VVLNQLDRERRFPNSSSWGWEEGGKREGKGREERGNGKEEELLKS